MIKYTIQLDSDTFVHMDTNSSTKSTPKLDKAKLWEKRGMLDNWTQKHYYKKFLDKYPNWKVITVDIEYTIIEENKNVK